MSKSDAVWYSVGSPYSVPVTALAVCRRSIGNLECNRAVCLRPLVTLTRRYVRHIPACKAGPNTNTKDVQKDIV
jgi:hypothetical protein